MLSKENRLRTNYYFLIFQKCFCANQKEEIWIEKERNKEREKERKKDRKKKSKRYLKLEIEKQGKKQTNLNWKMKNEKLQNDHSKCFKIESS